MYRQLGEKIGSFAKDTKSFWHMKNSRKKSGSERVFSCCKYFVNKGSMTTGVTKCHSIKSYLTLRES